MAERGGQKLTSAESSMKKISNDYLIEEQGIGNIVIRSQSPMQVLEENVP